MRSPEEIVHSFGESGSSCLRSRERRSTIDHPTDYCFSLAEDALERPKA